LVSDAAVVGALRTGIAARRESQWAAVFVKEIFLFEADPEIWIVFDGGAHIRGVRRAIGMHHFAENNKGVFAAGVRVQSNRLQNTVRAMTFSLHGRAAVKSPERQVAKRRLML